MKVETIKQAESAIRAEIARLQDSSEKRDRKRANALAGVLCAHARGKLGDCLLVSAAKSLAS